MIETMGMGRLKTPLGNYFVLAGVGLYDLPRLVVTAKEVLGYKC